MPMTDRLVVIGMLDRVAMPGAALFGKARGALVRQGHGLAHCRGGIIYQRDG
jgi:hypothetical protein